MDNEEYVDFIKSLLIKIENVLNLLDQKPSKHIPAYQKMLGVNQKIAELNRDYRNKMFHQMIKTRGIINYLMNGRYEDARKEIIKLKSGLVHICLDIQGNNENNKV